MATLAVGASQRFRPLADAIAAARDGDVVLVQAETYVNDFAIITQGQAGTTMLAARPALSLASPVGSSQHSIGFNLSEDRWQGDAQAVISIDGKPIGGVRTVTASHALGQEQTISFLVPLSDGPHAASVAFVNDAWDGTGATCMST